MKRFTAISVLPLLLLVGCSDSLRTGSYSSTNGDVLSAEPKASEAVFVPVSPDVNIHFSNNYDGDTDLAEPESFNLRIDTAYSSGTMVVRLHPDAAIKMQSDITYEFVLDGDALIVPLEFQVIEAGRHRLRYTAELSLEGVAGTLPATSGIVISVGSSAGSEATQSIRVPVSNDSGEPLIRMPSEEIIR